MKLAKELAPVDVAIIDCFYVAYRGYCVTPPLQSSSGMPTSAIHGFLGAVRKMVKELQPKTVIVATEGRTNLRDQMSSEYKEGRTLPEPFSRQIPMIYEMCKLFGWHLVERDGYEADDVIVSIGAKCKARNQRAVVFTTDKDIISRVSDDNGIIGVFKSEKGKAYVLEASDYTTQWGLHPCKIPEVLCLCGDSVDNVPGVSGIGEKTAIKLIQTYGSVEGVLANLDKIEPPRVKKLLSEEKGRESLKLSQQLITLNDQLELDSSLFTAGPQQTELLREFFLKLDMVKTAESFKPVENLLIPIIPS